MFRILGIHLQFKDVYKWVTLYNVGKKIGVNYKRYVIIVLLQNSEKQYYMYMKGILENLYSFD